MGIKAALLDERGIYIGMDEVASAADFGPRHLPQIVVCDLPPGEYLWVPDERVDAADRPLNHYRGAFWGLAWLRDVAKTRRLSTDVRARAGRTPLEQKGGVDVGALVAYLEERGL